MLSLLNAVYPFVLIYATLGLALLELDAWLARRRIKESKHVR